ncbi:MAG: SEL1-like repeat protein, partial [Alphaproteobacteria bacterium]|nr:SEL1-like repeat protein [Alphaproteobacteria bacterium]
AQMYRKGQGVDPNSSEAHMWFSAALAQGNPEAQTWIDFIEKKLPAQQLNETRARSAKFVTKAKTRWKAETR